MGIEDLPTSVWILILAAVLVFVVAAILFALLYRPGGGSTNQDFKKTHRRGSPGREQNCDNEGGERPNYMVSGLIILLFVSFALLFVFRCKGKKFV